MIAGLHTAAAVARLALQGVRRRPLSSLLTILSVALGIGLIVAVATLRSSAERSFQDAARGYDVILAPAHGSALTAVLSTLFHVDAPGGTIPWTVYEEAKRDPRVSVAVPYAMGDTYRGHRVVGTSPDLFEVLRGADGRHLWEGVRGRMFREGRFEAVVGSAVARAAGLALGQEFQVTHGLVASTHQHDERWTVVGVLRPTGTSHDRAIYIPIDRFFAIPGHGAPSAAVPDAHEDEPAHEDEHDDEHDAEHEQDDGHEHDDEHEEEGDEEHGHDTEPPALSAVGLRLKSPTLRLGYLHEYRTTRTDVQAVHPIDQVRKLNAIVGDVNEGVRLIAWLVTVVAALGILVGLYNTIHGRRREIALLRALGARPHHVFGVILLEAVVLCLLGGLMGILLGHGALAVAAPTLLERYGVRVVSSLGLADVRLLLAVVGLGLLAGILPAWRGLTTPVAENLEPGS